MYRGGGRGGRVVSPTPKHSVGRPVGESRFRQQRRDHPGGAPPPGPGRLGLPVGGSESETTLRRNRHAFDKVAFRPRVLGDVSNVDPSNTFLGHKLRIPALLAPIGSCQVFDPEARWLDQGGHRVRDHARHQLGTEPTLEEYGRRDPDPEGLPALRARRHEWVEDIVKRVKDAGYAAWR